MNRPTTLTRLAIPSILALVATSAAASVISTRVNAGTGEVYANDSSETLTPSVPETLNSAVDSPHQTGASSAARGGIGLNNIDLGVVTMSENRSGAPSFSGSAIAEVEDEITFFNITEPAGYDGLVLKMRLKGKLTITGQGANGYSRDHVARLGVTVHANRNQGPDRDRRNAGSLELFFLQGSGSVTQANHSGFFVDDLNNRSRPIQTSGSPESHASLSIDETLHITIPDLHLVAGPHKIRIALSAFTRNGGSAAFYNSLSFDESEPVLLYKEQAPGNIETFTPADTGLVVRTEGGGFVPDPDAAGPGTNLALTGSPIMGHAPLDNGSFGVYHINAQGYLTPHNSQTPAELNDGDIGPASVVDTYSGDGVVDDPDLENPDGGADPFDFFGVTWPQPKDAVVEVRLYHRIFSDGGWFGGLNNPVAPKVQVTRDGGTTWTDVAGVESDYVTLVSPPTQNGQIVGPVTFTFPPQDGIDGIRLFGESGGRAGADVSGFVAAAEFEVYADARPLPPSDFETNVARSAEPLMGHAPLDNGSFGVYHINAQGYLTPHNSQTPAELNDGDTGPASVVDTYSGDGVVDDPALENPDGGADPFDFLGVRWARPRDGVNALRLYHRIFSDGGWFGGLTEPVTPKVQVTRDGGTTWSDVAAVGSDYLAVVSPSTQNGQVVGPVEFTFPPQDGIDGIRLFGEGGGRAGADVAGFVAAAELEVYEVYRPPLRWARTADDLSLTWNAPGFHLETSTDLVNWSPVEGAGSPFPVPADPPARFYRLAW